MNSQSFFVGWGTLTLINAGLAQAYRTADYKIRGNRRLPRTIRRDFDCFCHLISFPFTAGPYRVPMWGRPLRVLERT